MIGVAVLAAGAVASFVYLLGISPGEAAAQSAWDRVHPGRPWRERGLAWFSGARRRWPGFGPQVHRELEALAMDPTRYLQQMAGLAAVGAVIVGIDIHWWLAPLGFLVGAALMRYYVQWRYHQWLQRCVGQVGDLVTLLKARLQAGDTVIKAMRGVTLQLMDPFAREWQRAMDALESGQSLTDVLDDLKMRLPDRDISAVLTQLIVYDRDSVPPEPFGTMAGHLARMKLLKRDYLMRQATGSLSLYEGLAFMGALIAAGVPLIVVFWLQHVAGGLV